MRNLLASGLLLFSVLAVAAQGREPSGRVESSRDNSETRINRIYEQPPKQTVIPVQQSTTNTDLKTQKFLTIQSEKKTKQPKPKMRIESVPAAERVSPR